MKWPKRLTLMMIIGALSVVQSRTFAQEVKVREYWTDPATGLMWAAKDNGKNVKWDQAAKYCSDLRLAGYSDWRLATLDELKGIFDKQVEAPGYYTKQGWPNTWHVKGNLYLSGEEWSSDRRKGDHGHFSGYAWYFNFGEGFGRKDEAGFSIPKRALCVRQP